MKRQTYHLYGRTPITFTVALCIVRTMTSTIKGKEKVVSYSLYSNDVQARRVTIAAQEALSHSRSTDIESLSSAQQTMHNYLNIHPQAWAGTLSIWSMYNVLLHRRAMALVEVPCHKHGIPIQTLGEYPLFTGLKLVRGAVSDVVIVPADEDPLYTSGKFPLPRQVAQRLKAIERAGVPSDLLYTYIAHEVPRNSVSEDGPLPLEVICPPAPVQTVQASEQLGTIAHAATAGLLSKLGGASLVGARGAAKGATLAGIAAGVAASLLLDPLIFGALADERGIATWFVIAQWAW